MKAKDIIRVLIHEDLFIRDGKKQTLVVGGGASNFIDLGDTPDTYAGQASKVVFVKSDETSINFASSMYWDDTNKRLGIGVSPSQSLQVNGVGMFGVQDASEVLLGMDINAVGHEGLGLYHDGTEAFIASIDAMTAWHDLTIQAKNIRFDAGGSADKLIISDSGYLGIGATPATFLHIQSASTDTAQLAYFFMPNLDGNTDQAQVAIGKAASNNNAAVFGFLNNTTAASSGAYINVWGDSIVAGTGLFVKRGGNVGIGTAAPDGTLEVNLGTAGQFRLSYNDSDGSAANYAKMEVSAAGLLTVTTVDASAALGHIALMPDGNVGVGTISPTLGKLQIDSGSTNTASLYITSNSLGWGSGIKLENSSTGGRIFGIYVDKSNPSNLRITDETAGSDRIIMNSSGDIGINGNPSTSGLTVTDTVNNNGRALLLTGVSDATVTGSVGQLLSVQNTNTTNGNFAGLGFYGSVSAIGGIYGKITNHTSSYGDIWFTTRSAAGWVDKMVILSTGNVGIMTTAPLRGLDINEASGNCLRLIYNDSDGSAANYADFLVSSSGDLTITPSGGSVTLGTSTDLTTGTIELGHASDTTLARVSAGVVSIEGVNILTVAGGTLTGNLTYGENTATVYDNALSADGKYTGEVIAGTAGAALAFGDLVYLDPTDSRWELADANSASAADGDARGILGICVLAAAGDGSATTILLRGFVRADTAFPTLTVNAPSYVSETAGDITETQPTTTDAVIRTVGFGFDANTLYFCPSSDYITHT